MIKALFSFVAASLFSLSALAGDMVSIYGPNTNPNPNILLNSAMEVDQEHEGASLALTTAQNKYVVDGWYVGFVSATGAVSGQRVADAPANFTNSLKVTVGTGAAVASADLLQIFQPIEADNITDLASGTSSAANVCFSWWVKSSIASYTYGLGIRNSGLNRTYVSNRTVSASATWTQDGFCFVSDTAGSWTNGGTGTGLFVTFGIAAGSTLQGTSNAWQAGSFLTGASPTNTILSTNSATFQVTGVKLEISPFVTPYKRNPFWQELAASQRYFVKTFAPGTAPVQGGPTLPGALCNQTSVTTAGTFDVLWTFPQIMRANPAITTYNPSAANANIRDITGASDVVVLVDPSSTKSQTSVEIGSQTTALTVARSLCIHAIADARL